MINCGITGHRGNLGKKFQVVAKNFKFKKFKGDIRKVKDVEEWIEKENFDLIIHFEAIVPISVVNKKYKDAIKYYSHVLEKIDKIELPSNIDKEIIIFDNNSTDGS